MTGRVEQVSRVYIALKHLSVVLVESDTLLCVIHGPLTLLSTHSVDVVKDATLDELADRVVNVWLHLLVVLIDDLLVSDLVCPLE